MGQQNSKPEPKRSDEELMRERWANLTQSSKKPESEKKVCSLRNGLNQHDRSVYSPAHGRQIKMKGVSKKEK